MDSIYYFDIAASGVTQRRTMPGNIFFSFNFRHFFSAQHVSGRKFISHCTNFEILNGLTLQKLDFNIYNISKIQN